MPALAISGRIDGTWLCHGWSGWLRSPQDEVETFARLGETGSGAQGLRTRAAESTIEVVQIAGSAQEALRAAEEAEAWQGKVLAVKDQHGRNFPRVRFHAVEVTVRGCRGNGPTGNRAAARVIVHARAEVLP
jgi:hypothetical protein